MNLKKEMSTSEIEEFLRNKNDFTKIDYLTRFLQEKLPAETRKLVFMKLGEAYERAAMFTDSGRAYEKAIELTPEKDRKNVSIKAAQAMVRAGDFNRADELIRNVMSKATDFERKDVTNGLKTFYLFTAEMHEKNRKLREAVKIYERVLTMNITDDEKKKIKTRLMDLYQKLGKVKEMIDLKGKM
jgi:tetratricopeptide (TPR) repeat protein